MLEAGLECAYHFDGKGGARSLSPSETEQWQGKDGFLWIQLRRDFKDAQAWLRQRSGLDPLVLDALLAQDTRPRLVDMEGGSMLFLRGVNLNPGADPEDMISVRLWIEEHRVISVRLRPLLAAEEMRERLIGGHGPKTIGEFLAVLAWLLFARMEPVITAIEDALDTAEAELLERPHDVMRHRITEARIRCIELRRYIAPQREAMTQLLNTERKWCGKQARALLRENLDFVTRLVEALDTARDRAAIMQDEIRNSLSERMNRNTYWLTLVAGIFLPLTFLTGLLGINVGGIPGAEHPQAFWVFLGILTAVITGQLLIFKRLKWF